MILYIVEVINLFIEIISPIGYLHNKKKNVNKYVFIVLFIILTIKKVGNY